jgi:hypothetical protein
VPALAVLAPAMAWRRHRLVRRRGRDVLMTGLTRRRHRGLVELRCRFDVPFQQLAVVTEALAGAAGEAAEALGLDLGLVGVVDRDEPLLTTLRPRRGDVAERFVRNLLAGESHRYPQLWLLLTPGSYLAEAVDPYRPFLVTRGDLPSPLRRPKLVRAGLLVTREDDAASCRLELALYAPVSDLRRIVGLVRPWLIEIVGRRTASAMPASPPSTTENSRLQR